MEIKQEIKNPIVSLQSISKQFGGIYALDSVNFDLVNEVHSIVGHNGAGKTTMVKILMGALQPDQGNIYLNGKQVEFSSPREAQQNHISMVWQELSNFPNLSITENLLMQRFVYNKSGTIDWKGSEERCKHYLERLSLDLNPRTLMGKLPLAQQQLVEFSKALSYDPSVLILDEPTSALSINEQEILYEKVNSIKESGVAVVFISHKLDEVLTLSDRVTVLRDGKKIFTEPASDLNKDRLVEGIIGDQYQKSKNGKKSISTKKSVEQNELFVLEVKNLHLDRCLKDISFELKKTEILGICGVFGSGISDIGKILFGIERDFSGDIFVNGRPYTSVSPEDSVKKGFGYVPKNRKEEGIIPGMNVGDNIILSTLSHVYKNGFVKRKVRSEIINKVIDVIDLRPKNPDIPVSSLSGGNQQKTVIARWISNKTEILILDEPTRGVDVGAIEKIYLIIRDLTKIGVSVIIISSEFEEVHKHSDRMLVLNRGEMVGQINPENSSWEEAFALAIK